MMLDFDEVLVSVNNPQIKKYVEEAVKSYRVGNYRSAILSIWVAAMFDLVRKFESLVDQRESSAIEKWKVLKPKIEDHKNWEKELICAAKDVAMVSRYEADSLENLIKTRNRYAHPSFDDIGILFDPTPEEVRYFIRTLYDAVLSQPAQLGAFYVNQLLESIKSPLFFSARPVADQLTLIKDLVIEKVSRINSKQMPRLVKEIFQSLNSPDSEEHELNLLCFIINLWGCQTELNLSLSIAIYWNEYISNKGLSFVVLEAILSYPECINELSEQSQKMIDSVFRVNILKSGIPSKSAIKFLASADIVPIAKSLLDEAPNLIPVGRVIRDSWHYKKLFGDRFSDLFGAEILSETRKALVTQDGYKVNPVLSALRCCGIWNTTTSLTVAEKENFASELIVSLNSNNFETMDLLCFSNRADIPTQWVKLLIEQWLNNLKSKSWFKDGLPYYWEHYLGLLERYTAEIGYYSKQTEILKILISSVNSSPHSLESISDLSSNVELWKFWRKILTDNQQLIQSTPFEAMT